MYVTYALFMAFKMHSLKITVDCALFCIAAGNMGISDVWEDLGWALAQPCTGQEHEAL